MTAKGQPQGWDFRDTGRIATLINDMSSAVLNPRPQPAKPKKSKCTIL